MVLEQLQLTSDQFEAATGWEIKPEGACRHEMCVPLPPLERDSIGRIDVRVVAERLGMPIAHDEAHRLWALGPPAGDRKVLERVPLPDLVPPTFGGGAFDPPSLRGKKGRLIGWAPLL